MRPVGRSGFALTELATNLQTLEKLLFSLWSFKAAGHAGRRGCESVLACPVAGPVVDAPIVDGKAAQDFGVIHGGAAGRG